MSDVSHVGHYPRRARSAARPGAAADPRGHRRRASSTPGAVIKDAELAERLGLSVAPIRVALARLADEGLVEAKPQSHTRVTPMVVRQVRDAAVVVRAMHELAVARGGRPTSPTPTSRRCAPPTPASPRPSPRGDVDAALAADDDLHAVPAGRLRQRRPSRPPSTASPRPIRRLERLRFDAAGGRLSVELHDRLIDACAAGDADAAVAHDHRPSGRRCCPSSPRRPPHDRSPTSRATPLLFGPSPVHRLDRLTEHLGGAAIWAKREDCNSGIAFGGNKTRKLEYLVADALAQGCDTLVSIGGVQSNHTRQVAAVAAHAGPALRARAGELGRLARRRLRQGRQHPDQPAGRRRRAAGQGRLRHRLQGELGGGARPRSRSAAASPTRSRPAPPTTRSAASASPAGRTRWPRRRPSSASSSTPSSSAR